MSVANIMTDETMKINQVQFSLLGNILFSGKNSHYFEAAAVVVVRNDFFFLVLIFNLLHLAFGEPKDLCLASCRAIEFSHAVEITV